MAKKKRNYRAERKAAQDFADAAMEGRRLPQKEWLQMWGVIYDARLAQIRSALTKGAECNHRYAEKFDGGCAECDKQPTSPSTLERRFKCAHCVRTFLTAEVWQHHEETCEGQS